MDVLPEPVREVVLELRSRLKDLYGKRFRGLLLYGSYARGEAWQGSDVDLLLLLEGPVNAAREVLATEPVVWPLALASGLVLSLIPADDGAYQRGAGIFLRTIRKEAIPVAA